MMDAHRVVGGNRPVQEAPLLAAAVLVTQLAKRVVSRPETQDGMFAGNEITVRNRLKHGATNS
jgi:hypothetical protein